MWECSAGVNQGGKRNVTQPSGPTTLTNTGLTFRQWNGDAGDKWREGKPIRVFRNFFWFVFVTKKIFPS